MGQFVSRITKAHAGMDKRMNIPQTLQALKDLSQRRKPEHISWVEEDCWAIDALRGSVKETGWRGTLSEYFTKNPNHVLPMANRACDRLEQLLDIEWPFSAGPFGGINIGLGTYKWYDTNVITSALDAGIRFIDTAETYGYGRVETALGDVLNNYAYPTTIATKVSRSHLSYNSIMNAAKRSLNRLRLNCIELYQIHWPNPKYDLGDSMDAMHDLMVDGLIKAVGVCNFSVDQLIAAQHRLYPYRIASIQIRYNLLDRGVERALLPYCQSINMPVIAYSPLGQKFSRMMKGKNGRVLTDISKRHGITEAQVALAWIMSWNGVKVIPIPRTNNPDHAREIADTMNIKLDTEDIYILDDAFPIME